MVGTDRDALICDMAETYHVYDLRDLPVRTIAILAVGLRSDSRIKMKMAEMKRIPPSVSLVRIADEIALLAHALVGKEGTPPPNLLQDVMHERQQETAGFSSIEEFEAARQRIINNG